MEAEYDKALKESQSQDNIMVRWEQGLNRNTDNNNDRKMGGLFCIEIG